MRGIWYAATEIAVFMIAATLLGYVLGRLAGWRSIGATASAAGDGDIPATEQAASAELEEMAIALDRARFRIVELESLLAEHEAVLVAPEAASEDDVDEDAPRTGPVPSEDERDSFGVEALLLRIEEQQQMIATLESVVVDTGRMENELREREARIARLEGALRASSPAGAALPAYSAASGGSGAFADSTVDFEILD